MDSQHPDPPVDFDSLRVEIQGKHAAFPKRLAQVSRYLMDYPDEVALGSVASVAEAAHVTPSTVMRFSQFLGYDGFSALQEVFRKRVRAKLSLQVEATPRKTFDKEGLPPLFYALGQTIEECCNALAKLSDMVDMAEIEGASKIISRAHCVFIHGTRSAIPMTVALQQSLIRRGFRCTLSMDLTGGDDVLALATREDAVIFISRSADGESLIHSSLMASKGVPIIAIVDSSLSAFTDVASVSFKLGRPGDANFLMPTLAIALTEVLVTRLRPTRA